ncbi:MAG TPA: DUF6578 domain-containing protein [Trebonia sp.]
MTVWVDAWQMQCCGKPFAVGSHVAWTLTAADAEWLMPVLGPRRGVTVDAAEDHHGRVPDDTTETTGTVTSISAVHYRSASQPGKVDRTSHPVPDSADLTAIEAADGWTPDRGDLHFGGYLVRIAV